MPQPGTPMSKIPLGSGSPKLRAWAVNAFERLRSHSLSPSRPPTPWNVASGWRKSSMPDLRMICSFSEWMMSTSNWVFWTSDFARTFSISTCVKPRAASATLVRAAVSDTKRVFHSKAREPSRTPARTPSMIR